MVVYRILDKLGRLIQPLRVCWWFRFNPAWKQVVSNGRMYLVHPQRIRCAGTIHINPSCYLNATGGIVFGKNVVLSYGVKILSTGLDLEFPCRTAAPHVDKEVVIGDNVWIAVGAIILPGVNIGRNAVVSAGAVVVGDVPPNAMVAGNPARMIRMVSER